MQEQSEPNGGDASVPRQPAADLPQMQKQPQAAGTGQNHPSSQRSILRRTSNTSSTAGSHDSATRRTHRLSWVDNPEATSASYRNIPEARQRALRERRRRRSSASEGSDTNNSTSQIVSEGDGSAVGGSRVGKRQRRRSSFLGSLADDSRAGHTTEGRRSSVGGGSTASLSGKFDDKKTRAVFCLRVVTIITLIVAAAATATLTYVYVSRDEQDDFRTQYQDSVVKVAEAFQKGLDVKTSASSTFSAMYTSRYGPANTWPNVTMPNFSEQAKGQLDLCEGRALSFNPIVTNDTRAGWEAFANESKAILGANVSKIQHVENGIFGKNPPANGSRYPEVDVPVWQIAPIESNERAVMFNLHSERDRMRALDDVLQYKVPTLTAMLQLIQDTDLRPSSILFYPVFNTFFSVNDPNARDVVGTISIVFSWDVVLASILPAYIKGMIGVIESSNGEVFTYKITGETATLLGEGDLHDTKYDGQRYTVEADLEGTAARLGIVDFLVTYRLSMYPSDEMRNQYITNKPALYTLGIILIFVCTAAIFLLYDYLVEHRQNKVMKAAATSSKIVDAMFPATFRDRMFKDAKKEEELRRAEEQSRVKARDRSSMKGRLTAMVTDPTAQMKQFLGASNSKSKNRPDFNVPAAIAAGGTGSEPIADLFPNTSIMFCDIVGFTAWSSRHTPHEVFTLLESLFWEFDELARLYSVFKLGTIGDCYIAVTGLPDPQEDHASLLAEFAEECRRKMLEVIGNVEYQPGSDGSSGLSMRFGIHSGPVTAGVLRGQKSRFELFGDTINVASRMESTGQANKIQVSEETAQILRNDGFGDWLVPRDGLVKAKGKGELKTYWLNVNLLGDDEYCEVGDYPSEDNVASDVMTNSYHYYNRETSDLSSVDGNTSKKEATNGGGSNNDVAVSDIETGDQ